MKNQKQAIIIGLGELLWDVFEKEKKLGGAPANFAYHCNCLNAKAFVVSSIGKDSEGKALLKKLKSLSLDSSYIQWSDYPTGCVNVSFDSSGEPFYDIKTGSAWDNINYNSHLKELASFCDVVCTGSLAQRSKLSKETIQSFLSNTSPNCLRVFDVNLRNDFFNRNIIKENMNLCHILKINEKEFDIIKKLLHVKDIDSLLEKYSLKMCALTLGKEGSILITKEKTSNKEAKSVNIVDPVGAGDSFTAALVMGVLSNFPLEKTHELANTYASYICSQSGGTPNIPPSFIEKYIFPFWQE